MLKTIKSRGLALVATVALLGGTAWIAAGTTGAYFSDTHDGAINGSIGSIQVTANGSHGEPLDQLSFKDMIPGDSQTVTVNYLNSGKNTQDVWITFPNVTALSALNNLGSFGEASLATPAGVIFHSVNLYDNAARCGTFGSGVNPVSGLHLCNPLLARYRVAKSVAPGHGGSVSFTFNYAGKMTTAPTVFNAFPVSAQAYDPAHPNNNDQTYLTDHTPGHGLPFQIVATQENQQP